MSARRGHKALDSEVQVELVECDRGGGWGFVHRGLGPGPCTGNPPVNRQTDTHTYIHRGLKSLPSRNFIGGNNIILVILKYFKFLEKKYHSPNVPF